MPEDRRLATLVVTGQPVSGALRDVARLMAGFHARAERSAAITAEGGRDALRRRWAANVAELAPFTGTVLDHGLVDTIDRLWTRFLEGRDPLFSDRDDHDRIIDGHGDLIAADVFRLDDGPRALGCLEFDDHLRYVDALDDVAFLPWTLNASAVRISRPGSSTAASSSPGTARVIETPERRARRRPGRPRHRAHGASSSARSTPDGSSVRRM